MAIVGAGRTVRRLFGPTGRVGPVGGPHARWRHAGTGINDADEPADLPRPSRSGHSLGRIGSRSPAPDRWAIRARSRDGRLASGRELSGFRTVATLPMKRTPQNTSEPLDGVVGIRGRGVPISGNAARPPRLIRVVGATVDFRQRRVVRQQLGLTLGRQRPHSRSLVRTHLLAFPRTRGQRCPRFTSNLKPSSRS